MKNLENREFVKRPTDQVTAVWNRYEQFWKTL